MVLVEQPAQNATLPLNGRVEFAFNHVVQVSETVREAQLATEAATISVRLDNQRMVRVEDNRVLVFFDPAVMGEGEYVLTIPAGAFQSERSWCRCGWPESSAIRAMWSEECEERSAAALAGEIDASARVEKRRFQENISVGCLF